jgi:hypothetical protein
MIETRFAIPLSRKRELPTLWSQGQMSNFQIDVAHALEEAGLQVTQEVMLANTTFSSSPFRIDIVVDNLDLAIEIDGKAYHDDPKSKERDKRKNKAIIQHGYKRTLRIPIEMPASFIYDPEDSTEIKNLKKKGYRSWKKAKIEEIVVMVKARYRPVENLETSVILKRNDYMDKYQSLHNLKKKSKNKPK